jgi:hypothetical protein
MKKLQTKLRELLINDKIRLSRFDKYVLKYTDYDEFKKKFLGLRNSKQVHSIFEDYKIHEVKDTVDKFLDTGSIPKKLPKIEAMFQFSTELKKEMIEKNNLKLQNVWNNLNIVKSFLDGTGNILYKVPLISVSKAAKYFKVSEDTIIKWDKVAKTNAIENSVINTSKFKYILKREFENKNEGKS